VTVVAVAGELEEEAPAADAPAADGPAALDGPPARRGLLTRLAFWRRRGRRRTTAQREADAQRRDEQRMAAGGLPARVRAGADEPSELARAVADAERGAGEVAPRRGEAGLTAGEAEAVLARALDALGQAHHRPFSRG